MVNQNPKSKILIIDDEPLNVKLLTAMIPPDQYDTASAYSGEEALKILTDFSPDLILLDIMMPGLNGYELTKILKSDTDRQNIPIVLVTAFGGSEYELKGLEAGADEFLNKPVNKTELLTRVKSLIQLRQYREQLKSRTCSMNSATYGNDENNCSEDQGLNLPCILIVEDNRVDAKLLQRYLHGEPYQIKLAADGEEAISRAQQERIDVILLDLLLPGKNGFEVCSTLKEMEQTQNIQIVAITGLDDLHSKLKGIELGVDDYLNKPVNMHVLRTRIKSLVKKKALLDRLCNRYEMAVHSAITDKLTGLYNRRYFDYFIDLELKRSLRENSSLALLMIDVDNFKQINDTLGHLRGDEILGKLGIIIKENIRETDLAARYGGEEFSIVMSNTGLEEASQLAERIRKSVEINRFDVESLSITVSIGIALHPKDADCLQELLNRADSALYTAKRQGKNRLCSPSQQLAPITPYAP
jgi:two-component system cell cycle response regulator